MNKFEKVSYDQFAVDMSFCGYDMIQEPDEVFDECAIKYVDTHEVYEKIQLPKRATAHSAGYDFAIPVGVRILSGERVIVPTGIKVQLDSDCVLLLDIRSSAGIRRGLSLANTIGIVDADYYNNPDNEGHIRIAVVNNSPETVVLMAGERIAQGIIVKYETTDDDSADGERNGGFGSTGRD